MRRIFLLISILLFVVFTITACSDTVDISTMSTEEINLSNNDNSAIDDEVNDNKANDNKANGSEVNDNQGIDNPDEMDNKPVICAYVCGAILNEGVYYFDNGAIKEEALKAAGGFVEGSAKSYINLAEVIVDGEKIYFPYEDELSSDISVDDALESEALDNLVNINKATKDELMCLTGIGESKARAIISYREENGEYNSIEEIMNIEGIKEGVFNKIKDEISVK